MIAIILAGGKGSRLAPWPAPKCLLPVNGLPMIERLISRMFDCKHVSDVVICAGYRANDIVAAVEHWEHVRVCDAGEDATMGERLRHVRNFINNDETVLVCYGDELADVDIGSLIDSHDSLRRIATYTACYYMLPFGVVTADSKIIGNQDVLVNIGFAILEPSCWEKLSPKDGLSDWLNKCKPGCYIHKGKRATVNSYADLQYAEEMFP